MAEDLATISSSGANYTSLSACEDGEDDTGARDLVSTTTNCVWRYISPAIDDTTAVTISGFTTSATYDIKIEVESAIRHEGVWSTSKQRLRDNTSQALLIDTDHVTVEGLQIEQYSSSASDEGIRVNAGHTTHIRNCIVRATTSTADQDGIYTGNWAVTALNIENCIVYGFYRGGLHAQCYNGANTQTWNIRNCTVWDNGGDGDVSQGNVVARSGNNSAVVNMNVDNTIAMNSGGSSGDFDEYISQGTINWSGDYNIDSDGTGSALGLTNHRGSRTATASTSPGTGDWVIFTNITAGSEDFHLQSDAENDAEGYGADLSGTFTDDIDFETRSDWDAGADEIVTAATISGAVTDGFSIADTDTSSGSIYGAAVADTLTVADTDTVIAIFSALSSDGFTVADIGAVGLTFGAAVADNFTVADTDSARAIFSASVSDGLTINDPASTKMVYPTLVAENITLSDSAAALANLFATVGDNFTVADLVTGLLPGALTGVVSENFTIADQAARIAQMLAAASDNFTIADQAEAVATLLAAVADGLTIADVSTGAIGAITIAGTVLENLQFSDSSASQMVWNVTVQDNLTVADQVSTIIKWLVAVQDNFTISDVVARESDAIGLVSVAFTATGATITFTSSKPGIGFTGASPGINLST